MSLYSVIDPPVHTNEVVSAIAALLSGGAGKPSDLAIYQHEDPAEPGAMWCRVQEIIEPGGRFESDSRFDPVPIQVKFEVRRGVQADPHAWLHDASGWAFGLLQGQSLTMGSGSSLVQIARQYRGQPAPDAGMDTLYLSDTYLCPVKP